MADDPYADRVALLRLAQWCRRYTPLVTPEASDSPESLIADVTGCDRLFHGERALAERVIRELNGLGLAARAALADTVGAAWALAHYGKLSRLQVARSGDGATTGVTGNRATTEEPCHNGIRVTAAAGINPAGPVGDLSQTESTATPGRGAVGRPCHNAETESTAEASGWLVIPPGKSAEAILSLPVESLRLPAPTLQLLGELGMRQVGQLELLPRSGLASRFGCELVNRLDRLLGRAPELTAESPPPDPCVAQIDFEHPVEKLEWLEASCERLLQQLAANLAEREEGVLELSCRLILQGGRPLDLSLRLFTPCGSAGHLSELLALKLGRIALEGPVAGIRLKALATGRLEITQGQLFSNAEHDDAARPRAELIERLSSRLGREAILTAQLRSDAQPEDAYQYRPALRGKERPPEKAKRSARATKPMPARWKAPLAQRPLRLLSRPLPLAVVAVAPPGTPAAIFWTGREHRTLHIVGPERIETGWWRHRPIRRDYYIVTLTGGLCWWIFRQLKDGKWFLHGTFE